MAIPMARLVPRVAVLATVAYCIWPSVPALIAEPESKPPAKVPELAISLLSPVLESASTRNPFARVVRATKHPTGTVAKAAPTVTHKVVNPLNGLRLDATCIMGDRRLAVINGRMYATHDVMAAPKPATYSLTILDVLPYKVLLDCEGQTVALAYSDTAARAAAPANPKTNAAPSHTTGPGVKKSLFPFLGTQAGTTDSQTKSTGK
jgi:hypothetical protein